MKDIQSQINNLINKIEEGEIAKKKLTLIRQMIDEEMYKKTKKTKKAKIVKMAMGRPKYSREDIKSYVQSHNHLKQEDMAKDLGISRSTLCKALKEIREDK